MRANNNGRMHMSSMIIIISERGEHIFLIDSKDTGSCIFYTYVKGGDGEREKVAVDNNNRNKNIE